MQPVRKLPSVRRPTVVPAPPSMRDSGRLLPPEAFRDRLEGELLRHARYLEPFGLIRIGPRRGSAATDALSEAVATEIRQTDSACLLPDGSCAVLALRVRTRELAIIVRRLRDAVTEIERERGDDPVDLVAALCGVDGSRPEAGMLWMTLSRAYAHVRASEDTVHAVS